MSTEKDEVTVTKGAFVDSLVRTATQIRKDRAETLADDAETAYRRSIEDMRTQLKRLQKQRRNSLDLSPTDINSLVAGKDFDGEAFAAADIKAGIAIRNLKLKIEIAEERYAYLFGDGEAAEKKAPSTVAEVS